MLSKNQSVSLPSLTLRSSFSTFRQYCLLNILPKTCIYYINFHFFVCYFINELQVKSKLDVSPSKDLKDCKIWSLIVKYKNIKYVINITLRLTYLLFHHKSVFESWMQVVGKKGKKKLFKSTYQYLGGNLYKEIFSRHTFYEA